MKCTNWGGGGISARLLPVNLPDKTEYIEGEQLDLSGLSLKFEEIGGESSTVSEYTSIPENGSVLKRGISSIQVNYKKDNVLHSAFIPIIVKYVVGIEAASFPKHSYKTKDALNTSGLKINLVYNDGSKQEISSGFTTIPNNGTIIGECTEVKIIYNDMIAYYKLNIDSVSKNISKNALISNYLATFRLATEDQIEELLKFHYAGDIDIADYWKVGDYRTLYDSTNIAICDFNKIINGQKFAVIMGVSGINFHSYLEGDSKFNFSSGGDIDEFHRRIFLNRELKNYMVVRQFYDPVGSQYSGITKKIASGEKLTLNLKKAPYTVSTEINHTIVTVGEKEYYERIFKIKINSITTREINNNNEKIKISPLILKYCKGDDALKYFKIKSNFTNLYYILPDMHVDEEQYITFKVNRGSYYASMHYEPLNDYNLSSFKRNIIENGEIISKTYSEYSEVFKLFAAKDPHVDQYLNSCTPPIYTSYDFIKNKFGLAFL